MRAKEYGFAWVFLGEEDFLTLTVVMVVHVWNEPKATELHT